MSESARSTVMYDAWDDVRRLRIVLAHHYHRVDPDQVWSIAPPTSPRSLRPYVRPAQTSRSSLPESPRVRFGGEPSQGRCRTINRTANDR